MSDNIKPYVQICVEPRINTCSAWTVEAVVEEGAIEQTMFYGPDAEERARDYAWHRYCYLGEK